MIERLGPDVFKYLIPESLEEEFQKYIDRYCDGPLDETEQVLKEFHNKFLKYQKSN